MDNYQTQLQQWVRSMMVTAQLRHTPEFASPPTIAQIERQIRWEAASIEAGIKRYREELTNPATTLADTSPGQRIIREIMGEFVPWLTDMQAVIKDEITNRPG